MGRWGRDEDDERSDAPDKPEDPDIRDVYEEEKARGRGTRDVEARREEQRRQREFIAAARECRTEGEFERLLTTCGVEKGTEGFKVAVALWGEMKRRGGG